MYETLMRGAPMVRCAAIAPLLLSLSACALIWDSTPRYKKQPDVQPLEVPADLPRREFQSRFPVPPVTGRGGDFAAEDEYELPRPPDLTEQILSDSYRVRRSGNLTWLVVNDVPGRVWPALSSFFQQEGIGIGPEDPRLGLKQTVILNHSQRARRWIQLDELQDPENLVLLTRVEHGVEGRSTEVQVRLVPVAGNPDSLVEWRDGPAYPDREARVIEAIADFLRENEDYKSYSQVALNLPREEKVVRVGSEDNPRQLELDFTFDRGWAEVTRALSAMDVAVIDRDRSDGVWYIDMRPSEARSRGWWFWRYQQEPEQNGLIRLERSGERLTLSVEHSGGAETADGRPGELLDALYASLRQ